MSNQDQNGEDIPAKSGKLGLILGLVAALVLGGGGFYAAFSGLIGGGQTGDEHQADSQEMPGHTGPKIVYVPLDPMIISLGRGATNKHLRFTAQLEVEPEFQVEVTTMIPRVLDVLNGYLRAVDARDVETPSALGRLRAQMLRRVQVVTGEGRIRDLLITEFVLN